MADFKLTEVAKKAGITTEEALKKLEKAGNKINGTDSMVSVEQARLLGVEPQQMLEKRKERLQQAKERSTRGSLGKEVVIASRNLPHSQPAPQTATRKISREDLLKRKSELNKDIQKVDSERTEYLKNKAEVTENVTPINEVKPEPIKHNTQHSPVADTAPIEAKPQVIETVIKENPPVVAKSEETKVENSTKDTGTVQTVANVAEEAQPKHVTKEKHSTATATKPEKAPHVAKKLETEEAPQEVKPRPRPAGPAGYVPPSERPRRSGPREGGYTPREGGYTPREGGYTPREGGYTPREYTPREGTGERRPSDNRSGGSAGGYRGNQDNRGTGARPSGGYQPREGGRGPASGGYSDRGGARGDDRSRPTGTRPAYGAKPGFGESRPETTIRSDEERRKEPKKFTPAEELAIKEKEAKKAKQKSDVLKTKDWNKTITEGIDELSLEEEILVVDPVVVVEELPVAVVKTNYRPTRPGDKRGKKKNDKSHNMPQAVKPTHIDIGENIPVYELAGLIGVKATELVKKLFGMGIMATVNQSIDAETAALLCVEYDIEVVTKTVTEDDLLPVFVDNEADLVRRPPIVTVMGHVDHGKTSLLDALRSTTVAEKEAGGITQHIGAYEVELNGRKITFLDTPGHEAFTSLRARGALLTDIVILVVAANDGVMPQTKEAIDHAKSAGVRIVVAINKIDRPDANPDKVRQQLSEQGIISDEWGGSYQFQEISAKNRTGIQDLLERVLLEADIMELKGNPNRPAEGIVIESQLDKQRGPVATVLVKNGTLNRGDIFVVGDQMGKVRAMHNYRGVGVKEASLSMPVEVMGCSHVPVAGDKFIVLSDEKIAKQIAELRANNTKATTLANRGAVSLTDFFDKVKQGEVKELNIIIKADAQGSLEALKLSLNKLSNQEVKVHILHDATGGITESDVILAMASKAVIIGFNVRPDANARAAAERENVSIELYSIIYKAIEDIRLALEGMLAPDIKENITGRVEIRQIFSVPKIGKIAGSYVTEGKIFRTSQVRVIRNSVVIYEGKISSLRRFTDDVKEVAHGYECGVSIEKYQDLKEGDILEVYEMLQEKRKLADVK